MRQSGPELRRLARAEWPSILVVTVLAGAPILLWLSPGHWLRAAGLVAAACLLAAVFRLLLSEHGAGALAVRAKWFDVLCYTGLGLAILITGVLLPR